MFRHLCSIRLFFCPEQMLTSCLCVKFYWNLRCLEVKRVVQPFNHIVPGNPRHLLSFLFSIPVTFHRSFIPIPAHPEKRGCFRYLTFSFSLPLSSPFSTSLALDVFNFLLAYTHSHRYTNTHPHTVSLPLTHPLSFRAHIHSSPVVCVCIYHFTVKPSQKASTLHHIHGLPFSCHRIRLLSAVDLIPRRTLAA